MIINYDFYNRRRDYTYILCQPNGTELFTMPLLKEKSLTLSLNELSEFTAILPYCDATKEYYDEVRVRKLLKITDIGMFMIQEVTEENNGATREKSITCKSLEYELSNKNIGIEEGSYKLYNANADIVEGGKPALLELILQYVPSWSIGHVDSDLWNDYRWFEVKDNNLYNFLKEECQEAYDCVFLFDTFKREINVYKTDNLLQPTDIYLSNDNLVTNLSLTENSENICTALSIFGDGDLSIRTVNPLGTPTLYDFTYYANEEWVDKALIPKILAWQKKVEDAQEPYSKGLLNLKNLNFQLIKLTNEKENLEAEKKSAEHSLGIAVVAGNSAETSKWSAKIAEITVKLEAKTEEVEAKQKEVDTQKQALVDTNKELAITNCFTIEEQKQISNITFQSSVTNTNFSVNDVDDFEEESRVMQDLYNYGMKKIKKFAQPTYEFTLDTIDFLSLNEYKQFAKDLTLGCKIIVEVDKKRDLFGQAILLSISMDLDNMSDGLSLTFANVLDFKSQSYSYIDLFNETSGISKDLDFESATFTKAKETYDEFNDYINKALDLSKQELITGSGTQEFVINENGIRGRSYDEQSQTYDKEEIWINKNTIAFSDDNFNSVKTALGKVTLGDGTKAYGLLADVIVGKLLCGSELVIANENNTFRVDANGVYLKNANIIMNSDASTGSGGQTLEEILDGVDNKISNIKIDTSKYDNVLTADGLLDPLKLQGSIVAGRNNIVCQQPNKVVVINDTGILMANSKNADGTWKWRLGVSADGIYADHINASATISGDKIVGGTIQGVNFKSTDGISTLTIDKGRFHLQKKTNPSVTGSNFTSGGLTTNCLDLSSDISKHSLSLYAYDEDVGCGNLYLQNCDIFKIVFAYNPVRQYINISKNDWYDIAFYVNGLLEAKALHCSGEKDAIVPTQHYGVRALYCEESDRVYFNTKGLESTTNKECIVELDPIFLETIELNSVCPYLIQLTSYSDARVWVESIEDDKFTVRSDKDTDFTFSLSAIRISYENFYIEEKELSNQIKKDIQKDVVERQLKEEVQTYDNRKNATNS